MSKLEEKPTRVLALLAIFIFLSACEPTYLVQTDVRYSDVGFGRSVALFLDGTGNDLDSRTNVAKLSEIVKNQNKPNLHVFYNEGVGTDYRILGAGTGWGMDKDIAEAYAFLTKYYKQGSDIYIFGFSRGAYASRILSGMIYSVGIYDLSILTDERRLALSTLLYNAYKSNTKMDITEHTSRAKCGDLEKTLFEDECQIFKAAKAIIAKVNSDRAKQQATNSITHYEDVDIKILGLWDTVEALGFVPTLQAVYRNVFKIPEDIDVVNPNRNYIDQICNIDNVFHALSLDDNREYVFTPITIKSSHVVMRCSNDEKERFKELSKVREVWFSGAHSDVGGGYRADEQVSADDTYPNDLFLSGVSLNWMIEEIKKVEAEDAVKLLPPNACVPQNPLGFSHDAENKSRLYERKTRQQTLEKFWTDVYGPSAPETPAYRKQEHNCLKDEAFVMHASVIERVQMIPQSNKTRKPPYDGVETEFGFDSQWYRHEMFVDCFSDIGNRIKWNPECKKIRRYDGDQECPQ